VKTRQNYEKEEPIWPKGTNRVLGGRSSWRRGECAPSDRRAARLNCDRPEKPEGEREGESGKLKKHDEVAGEGIGKNRAGASPKKEREKNLGIGDAPRQKYKCASHR